MSDEEKTSQGTSASQLKGGVDATPDEGKTGQESKKCDLYTHQYNQLIARHGALNDSFNRIITGISGATLAISVAFLTDFNEIGDHFLVRLLPPVSWFFLVVSTGCMLICIHATTKDVEFLIGKQQEKKRFIEIQDLEGKRGKGADHCRNAALIFLFLGVACVLGYGAVKLFN